MPINDPEPQRIYAIGDIHGRVDLLRRAIAAIERDVAERGPAALTVTLGDYIDRGPDFARRARMPGRQSVSDPLCRAQGQS